MFIVEKEPKFMVSESYRTLRTNIQYSSFDKEYMVIVVRSGKTKKDSVQNSLNLLRKVNANIIGTVLNGVDISRSKYYYYYGEE